MALSAEKLAYFESQGPEAIRLEVGQRKHGQAADSPIWQETIAWVEAAESRRDHALSRQSAVVESRMAHLAEESNEIAREAIRKSEEANAIANSALKTSRLSARLAALAILLTIALASKEVFSWLAK